MAPPARSSPRPFLFALLLLLILMLLLPPSAVAAAAKKRDPYKVLGVPRNADDAAVKRAYRKASLKHHPDRVQDESKKAAAQERFTEAAAAYELLSDPAKRRIYDQTGDDGSQPPPQQHQQQHGGGGFGGGGFGGFGGFGGGGGGFPGGGFPGGGFPGGGFPGGGFGGGFGGFGGGQQQQQRPPPPPPPPPPPLFVNSPVTLLTTANFRSLTLRETRGARVVLLEFFQNSCGACREVHAPMLAKLAEQLRGAALVAAVDCSPGAATERICAAQKVAAFPTLRLLFEGGSADVPEAELRNEGRLRTFVLARLPSQKVALTDGDGPASRRKLGDLARRCDVALAASASASAAAGGGAGSGGGGGGGARSRGSLGCAVFFSDKKEPAPLWSALSLSAEFDSTRPEAANASTVDDRKVTAAQLPGFVFVFAQTGKGEGGQGVRPGVAADLGVRALPAVVLLHGAALADFELRELRGADVAARGGPSKRRGEVEAIADTEGRVRGRRLLEPAAVAGGYETLRAALLEHQRGVGLALRAAARIAAKRAQAAGVRAPSHEEASEAPPAVLLGDDGGEL